MTYILKIPMNPLWAKKLAALWSLWYFHAFLAVLLPRGWISRLKKRPRPSNLHTTYLSRYSRRWCSQKKYFPNRKYFFRIYKLRNTPFFLEDCKLEKKYFRLDFFFLPIPLHRILRQVGRVQIWRSWYFFKRDTQPRSNRKYFFEFTNF